MGDTYLKSNKTTWHRVMIRRCDAFLSSYCMKWRIPQEKNYLFIAIVERIILFLDDGFWKYFSWCLNPSEQNHMGFLRKWQVEAKL